MAGAIERRFEELEALGLNKRPPEQQAASRTLIRVIGAVSSNPDFLRYISKEGITPDLFRICALATLSLHFSGELADIMGQNLSPAQIRAFAGQSTQPKP